MTVVTTPKTDTSQNNGLLNYRITAQIILELLELEETDEFQAYISHQKGDEYAGDYEVSSPRLSYWLHWFNNAI